MNTGKLQMIIEKLSKRSPVFFSYICKKQLSNDYFSNRLVGKKYGFLFLEETFWYGMPWMRDAKVDDCIAQRRYH